MAGKVRTYWVQHEQWNELEREAVRLADSSAPRLLVALARASLLGLPSPLPSPSLAARLLSSLREGPATAPALAQRLGVATDDARAVLSDLAAMLPGEVEMRDIDGAAMWVYVPGAAAGAQSAA